MGSKQYLQGTGDEEQTKGQEEYSEFPGGFRFVVFYQDEVDKKNKTEQAGNTGGEQVS